MYNIKPGPMIFEKSADQVQAIFQIALITQILLWPCGYVAIKTFGWILKLPRSVVMTGVVVFSVVGSYAINNSMFDVYVMVAFGFLGWYFEAHKVPLGPLILGLILGPMVEENLRTGLIKTGGSFVPFFTRPICAALVTLMTAALAGPWLWERIRRGR
jgi:TctA family transporter